MPNLNPKQAHSQLLELTSPLLVQELLTELRHLHQHPELYYAFCNGVQKIFKKKTVALAEKVHLENIAAASLLETHLKENRRFTGRLSTVPV